MIPPKREEEDVIADKHIFIGYDIVEHSDAKPNDQEDKEFSKERQVECQIYLKNLKKKSGQSLAEKKEPGQSASFTPYFYV